MDEKAIGSNVLVVGSSPISQILAKELVKRDEHRVIAQTIDEVYELCNPPRLVSVCNYIPLNLNGMGSVITQLSRGIKRKKYSKVALIFPEVKL